MATQSKKNIRKGFFEVGVPLISAKVSLYGASAEEMNGKVVTLDLTRSLKGKSFEMKVKVKAEGEVLTGETTSLDLAGSYIRRMIRKGTDYVEDSFEVECRDCKARMKVFMITRNKVSRTLRNKLRMTARDYLMGYTKAKAAKEVFSDMMANRIQKDLSLRLKKIYPLALCEIKTFVIEKEKKIEEAGK